MQFGFINTSDADFSDAIKTVTFRVGADWFFNENVALHSTFGYSLVDANFLSNLNIFGFDFNLLGFLPTERSEEEGSPLRAGRLALAGSVATFNLQSQGNNDAINVTLNPRVGYFFTDQFLAGGAFLVDYTNNNSLNVSFTTAGISPYARYYFNNHGAAKKAYWFAELDLDVWGSFLDTELIFVESENGLVFNIEGKVGADWFLTPNFAIEGTFGIGRFGDTFGTVAQTRLGINVGLQYLIR